MAKKFNPQDAIKILKDKGANNYVCPLCGGRQFGVHDEIATISVTPEFKTVRIGNHVPAAILICHKCGNMQFFAIGMWGMMDDKDGDEA